MEEIFNPEALPSFFRDVEIIGPADLELPKYCLAHSRLNAGSSSKTIEITTKGSPVLFMTKSVREIYENNDFATIKNLEKNANDDLRSVYTNISSNGDKAWTKVRKNDREFYMSWSNNGSIWAYTENMTALNDTTLNAQVQIGTYSKSNSILGIHTYNLSIPVMIAESAIAYIVARAVSGIIAEGLGFTIATFSLLLAQAASRVGLTGFSFFIPSAVVSAISSVLVFAIVFIGLQYLWNWLNRKYTIRLQIFNWDDKNSWKVNGQYLSNAKICGDNQELNFELPKMLKPGEAVTPPGFDPVEVLDSVCYYAIVVWENDNTFLQVCDMAIQVQKNDTEGFMWAFSCPRFTNNKQAANNGLEDPKAYLDGVHWNSEPLGFRIRSTSGKNPVIFALDALSGAPDDLYNINIHINKEQSNNIAANYLLLNE
ncbi:hypothetical protein [Lacrimispora sp. 38-1]|uniref:hypothetical protein n=1 Tax=Lacrimispora sp. 38-1 TaxID=3125778 RepID=UPI003CF23268